MLNKWSGRNNYRCSQDLLESAFDQILDVKISLIEISEYNMKCDYTKCNGYHVTLKGEDPVKIVRDYEVFMDEKSESTN